MKEIMWNISLNPSHWPFLRLLESHVFTGSFQKLAHDVARLGKRIVAQEPWVSWCHFCWLCCLIHFSISTTSFCKGSSEQLGRERRECHSSQCPFQRDLCWERSPETQLFLEKVTWKHSLPERGEGVCKTVFSLLHECCCQQDERQAPLCLMVFCSPTS